MLKLFKKELNISMLSSLIYIVLGIVIISKPEETMSIVGKSVAILAIVYGVINTIINIVNIKEESSLLFGVFTIVMGIALLIYPNTLGILLSLGIGIWFIASSVTRLKFAVLLTLTTVSGVMMIGYSLIDIFEIIFIKRNIKAIEKVLQ